MCRAPRNADVDISMRLQRFGQIKARNTVDTSKFKLFGCSMFHRKKAPKKATS